jgi:hypothetical protein
MVALPLPWHYFHESLTLCASCCLLLLVESLWHTTLQAISHQLLPTKICVHYQKQFVQDLWWSVAMGQAILWTFWFSTLHYHLNNASYTPNGTQTWGCSTEGLYQKPLTNTRISTNGPEIYRPSKNSRCQKDDMQQVPYWEPTNIRQRDKKCNHPGDQDLCTSADKHVKTKHLLLRNTVTVLLVDLWPSTCCASLLCRNSNEVVQQNTMLHKDNNLINLLNSSSFLMYHQILHSKILHGARFALSVLYGSQNRQRLLLYTS